MFNFQKKKKSTDKVDPKKGKPAFFGGKPKSKTHDSGPSIGMKNKMGMK